MANNGTVKKKILGYYHLYLVNEWESVVQEQVQKLVDSGLYDESEQIYCGVLGDNKSVFRLLEILKEYPKFLISEISINRHLYEFQTLNIMKVHADMAQEDYYTFYIHMKGIQYGIDHEKKYAFHGGSYWRRWMDGWTVIRWRENIAELEKGYEICGTQLRVRTWPTHYSGNFFWARSEYIKTLKPIAQLDLTNRMSAEFWHGSNTPIAATLSQEWVDYETPRQDGVDYSSVAIQVPKGRNIIHSLCWNTVDQVERSVKSMYALNDKKDFEHIIVDLDFPIIKPDEIPTDIAAAKKQNNEALVEIANRYGSKYARLKNIGVSQNWQNVAASVKLQNEDVLIGLDPDELIHENAFDWAKAMGTVLRSKNKYGVASLIMQEQLPTLNDTNSEKKIVDGIKVIEVNGDAMWCLIGVNGELINKIGGMPFPNNAPIYGGLESALNASMQQLKYKWCFLEDYSAIHPEWDFTHLLRKWKHYTLENMPTSQIPFEQWLELQKVKA